jgi:hypothetical protein
VKIPLRKKDEFPTKLLSQQSTAFSSDMLEATGKTEELDVNETVNKIVYPHIVYADDRLAWRLQQRAVYCA